MTLAQAALSDSSPITIGLALGVITALVGSAWKLSAKMSEGIAATKQLRSAVEGLSADFNGHITKSDERDAINQREHAALNRCCDSNVTNISQLASRMARLEGQGDHDHTRLAVVETRLDIRRAQPGA